eukprot:jgi/Mesvir1/1464/Mv14449-RA.1
MASKKAKTSAEATAKAEEGVELASSAALQQLQTAQDKLEKLEEELDDEVFKIQREFQKKRVPHYRERSEIIRTIDNFWLTALMNHPILKSLISEEDQMVLRYLEDLSVDDKFEDGYTIAFVFKENPYFENRELVKEIKTRASEERKQPVIKWKKDMNVVEKVARRLEEEKKARQAKKGGKKRNQPINDDDDDEPLESFFAWFTEEPDTFGDDEEINDVGQVIKQDLWPNPVALYLGLTEFEDGDDDDGSDLDGEDGEDDEEA